MRWPHACPGAILGGMKLYLSPLACSLATRIALYEASADDVVFVEVDPDTKKTLPAGLDYTRVHALGMVPLLELDDGQLLSENAAVLQYVADRFPGARLAPVDPMGRARLHEWLGFIGTELHKAVFVPLLDKRASKEAKAYALSKADRRLAWLAARLEGVEHVLGDFSIADAYLFAVLNWARVTPVDLEKYTPIAGYHARLGKRASVARAFAEERALYVKELARSA